MTPSPPHDRPTPNASTEVSRSTQWSVGWALTAITFTILLVGVAIIRQLSAEPQSVDTTVGAEIDISPKVSEEQESPPRLVLRPEESDSASINSSKNRANMFSRDASPAAWNGPSAPEKNEVLPAYR